MSILSISKMVFSSQDGWLELEKTRPSAGKLFATLCLPLSLLPPALLFHAGSQYGDVFLEGSGDKPWAMIAVAFFLAEWLTLLGMGWFIRQFAAGQQVTISARDAYLLAGIAPIPLWLSSLGLLIPSLPVNAGLSLLALAASCSLIYHGVYALCHLHEDVTAAAITQAVIGAGLAAWSMLLILIVAL